MGTVPAPNIVEDAALISESPLTEYARSVALQGQQEQVKQQQMQTQQMQQQLADQQAMTASMRDPDFKSMDDLPDLVKKHGGSFNAYQDTLQKVVARKTQLATLDKDQLANMKEHHDMALGAIDAAEGVPDEQLMQHVNDTVSRLQAAGHIDQNTANNIVSHAQSMPPDQFRPWLDVYKKGLMAESAVIGQAKTQSEIKKNEAEQHEKEATAGKAEAEAGWEKFPELGLMYNTQTGESKSVAPGGAPVMTPGMMEAKYVALQQKQNSGQKLSKDDAAWAKGYEHYKTLVPVANFNLQNAGAAADAGGNPSAIAQAIASNHMKWSEAVSPRTPQSVKNSIMAQVFKLNPNYDTGEFGLEQDAAKKARTGAWADNRLAYNTALDHSDLLLQAAKALDNGDVTALNSLKNRFKTEFGWDGQVTFDAIANAYNHEVNSVISKNHTTDAEIAAGHATLPDNANLKTIKSVVGAYKALMTSKRDELDKIVKATAGNKADQVMATGSSSAQAGATSHQVGDVIVQNGHRYKATKVDKNGKVTAADPL
jgi:hypothetical protein